MAASPSAAPASERHGLLLFLELNEVNFDFLRTHADDGKLPTLKRLLDAHEWTAYA